MIFLTSRETDTASRFKALQAGANGFLSMPLDPAEVVAQLRTMAKLRATTRLQQEEGSYPQVLVAERTRELERRFEEARSSLERKSLDVQLGERWFEVIGDPILDEKNNLTGAVHIVSDTGTRLRRTKLGQSKLR